MGSATTRYHECCEHSFSEHNHDDETLLLRSHWCLSSWQAGGLQGDGYRGREHPHTQHESFEGITIHRSVQVCWCDRAPLSHLRWETAQWNLVLRSHALVTFKFNIKYILHSPWNAWNASLVVRQHGRGGRSYIFRLRSCSKILESRSDNFKKIWKSDSCSDSGNSHQCNRNSAVFTL